MSRRAIVAAALLFVTPLALFAGCHSSRRALVGESGTAPLPPGAPETPQRDPALPAAALAPSIANPPAEAAPAPAEAPAPVTTPPRPPAHVKIGVRATPRAFVSWGKKALGLTPVTVERPRDSGPVDLVVRAKGYLPFHTRAYTFKNETLTVALVKPEDSMKLLGAKKAPPVAPAAAAAPGANPAAVPKPAGAADTSPDAGAAK